MRIPVLDRICRRAPDTYFLSFNIFTRLFPSALNAWATVELINIAADLTAYEKIVFRRYTLLIVAIAIAYTPFLYFHWMKPIRTALKIKLKRMEPEPALLSKAVHALTDIPRRISLFEISWIFLTIPFVVALFLFLYYDFTVYAFLEIIVWGSLSLCATTLITYKLNHFFLAYPKRILTHQETKQEIYRREYEKLIVTLILSRFFPSFLGGFLIIYYIKSNAKLDAHQFFQFKFIAVLSIYFTVIYTAAIHIIRTFPFKKLLDKLAHNQELSPQEISIGLHKASRFATSTFLLECFLPQLTTIIPCIVYLNYFNTSPYSLFQILFGGAAGSYLIVLFTFFMLENAINPTLKILYKEGLPVHRIAVPKAFRLKTKMILSSSLILAIMAVMIGMVTIRNSTLLGNNAPQIIREIAIITTSILIISIALFMMLAKTISAPILDIVKEMERVSGGDLTAQPISFQNDEIGILGRIFNAMVNQLKEKKEEIDALTQNLEQKVKDRTQDLERANEQLKTIDALKSRFFSNITHEFRTPLVVLSTVVQMMRNQGIKDPKLQDRLLESSQESIEDMLENVNDLLTKTRSEKGMLEMRWAAIDIGPFVAHCLKVFEPIVIQRNNQLLFTNRLTENLRLYADHTKLKKIINNLVGNAMKFTKNGKIEVTLDCSSPSPQPSPARGEGEERMCIISVKDNGPGIPQEDLPTLFDPFTQASNNPSKDAQGTGLGLAMVKDFVQSHHGSVNVESTLGEGSLFTVQLPLGDHYVDESNLDTSQLIEAEDSHTRINLGLTTYEDIDFSIFETHAPDKHHILLVEDNPHVMQALAYLLKDHYNLSFAKDGQEGLDQARAVHPNLVISDIMMPVMNGYQLVRTIKKDPDLKMIPVILLTSKTDIESKIKGLEEGADEYLSKPFDNLEVLTRIKGLIERRKIEIEFIHAEKLISLGQLAAGIAHEINNPIYFAENSAQNIRKSFDAIQAGKISLAEGMEIIKTAVAHVENGTARVRTITNALSKFIRQGASGFHPNNIHDGIDSTLLIVHTNRQSNIQWHKQYDLTQEIVCNINQLNQVFMNIIQNAVQALDTRPNGDIWIHTFQEDHYAYITIRDNGPGIPEPIQHKIFDPFFTTKDVGKGTGLGLYISQQIVQEHNGSLSVKSTVNEGTEFTIQLPIQRKEVRNADIKFTHTTVDRGMENLHYPYRG